MERSFLLNDSVGRPPGVICSQGLISPAICLANPEGVKAVASQESSWQLVSLDNLSICGSGSDDAVWSVPLFRSDVSAPW
jgi:hypothetical protein